MSALTEAVSTSLHDLPMPLRARIARALPVKSLAALRTVSKHIFDLDTIAYLGVEDRLGKIALTIHHHHLAHVSFRS